MDELTANKIANEWKVKSLMEEGILNWEDEIKKKEQVEFNQLHKNLLVQYLEYIKDKKLGEASELLVQYIKKEFFIYTTKNDNKSEIWIYKNGIYVSQGKSEIKEALRKLLGKWYSLYIVNQVMAKIEADTYIEADKFFFSKYPNEIPVENGLLNIFTLDLNPFTPYKIFFTKLPVKFEPSATCEKIESFLKDVLNNPEDIQVFYEIAGFALLKEYKYEKAFMFLGYGRNGKGKTIELLKRLIGMDNCCSIPLSSLIPESFSISELFNKMLNLAGDIGNKDLKETSMFKSLSGRDLVGGKRKFLPDIHFENYAKFVFACNELPMVYDTSKGFWDRWILLNFPYTFVTKEEYNQAEIKDMLKIRDDEIIEKITTSEEMSGLLNEALIGLNRLILNKKFSTTKGSEEVKMMWIKNSNSFMAFCMDYIEEDYNSKITKIELRRRYSAYCKQHKLKGKSDIVIKNTLQEVYGASEVKKEEEYERKWFWEGIKWKI